jgi:hypothetical protein
MLPVEEKPPVSAAAAEPGRLNIRRKMALTLAQHELYFLVVLMGFSFSYGQNWK